MKKLLIGVIAFLGVLAVAAFVAPRFVDWNAYKDDIEARAEKATGRTVTIGGDLHLALLPTPAVVVEDLRIANAPGGVAADLLHLRKAEVEMAFMPLLSGRFEVRKVRLVEPVLAVELLPDGRGNWTFEPKSAEEPAGRASSSGESATIELPPRDPPDASSAPPSDETAEPVTLPEVRLDAVEIEDGVVIYRDMATGQTERLERLDATVRAGTLQGPFESRGAFVLKGNPLAYELSVGELSGQAAVPVKLALSTPSGEGRLQVSGSASDIRSAPRFQGEIEAEAADLAAAIEAWTAAALPSPLAKRARVEFEVEATPEKAHIGGLSLRLGDATAEGAATVEFGEIPVIAAQLVAGRIDLQPWLEMPAVSPPTENAAPAPAGEGSEAGEGVDAGEGVAEPPTSADAGEAATLPTSFEASVALSVEALTYRDGIIRQARASFDLADGAIAVRQVSALFPGGADATLSGAVTDGPSGLTFDGRIDAQAADLRGVLRWLGIEVAAVPSGRLRTLTMEGAVAATAGGIRAHDIDMRLDGSRIRGDLAAALDAGPTIEADLSVDRINLDAYLPRRRPGGDDGEDTAASGAGISPGDDEVAEAPPLEGDRSGQPAGEAARTAGLDQFKADVALRVETLTYLDTPARDVVLDGELANGVVTVRRAGVGDFAGTNAALGGVVKGLPQAIVMEGVTIEASVPDPTRLARVVGVDLAAESPIKPPGLGAISVQGRLDGVLDAPVVDLRIRAADAEVGMAGHVNPPGGELYRGSLRLVTSDPNRLLSGFGVDYRPAGPLGPTDLTARVTMESAGMTAMDLSGRLGGTQVDGSLGVAIGGPRPKITADLATGRLVVDAYLPAQRSAGIDPTLVPVMWRPPDRGSVGGRGFGAVRTVAVDARWSEEPFDLSGLQGFDADLALRADGIAYQGYALDAARVTAKLEAGVLAVERLAGSLYGGPTVADVRIDTNGRPSYGVAVKVEGADLAQAPAVAKGIAAGRLNLETRLESGGSSAADVISALNGQGSFALRGLDPAYDASQLPVVGPVLGSTVQLVGAINATLGPLLGVATGRTGTGLADVSGPFTVDSGVARFDSVAMNTGLYRGQARGTADLAAWRLDMTGEIALAESALAELLSGIEELPTACSFAAEGRLDRPNVKLGSGCLPAKLTIPGTGRNKDLGDVLEDIIPEELKPLREGVRSSGDQDQPQETPGDAPEKTPEKVIKDLFEGFIKGR